MSEQSPGPNYWQASDGLWYPPESHPNALAQAPVAPPAPGMPMASSGGYPARLTVSDDNKIANWRALVHIFMAIPHMIVLYLVNIVAQLFGMIGWFAIMFTGKMPEGIHNMIAMSLRYSNRLTGFMLLVTEEYPPFEFDATAADGSGYPIRSDFDYQPGPRSRLTTFFRIVMVIPHYFALTFMLIGAYLAYFVAWFAVLFTGKNPDGIRKFLIGVGRWVTRVQAYFWLLTDEYPPFSLD